MNLLWLKLIFGLVSIAVIYIRGSHQKKRKLNKVIDSRIGRREKIVLWGAIIGVSWLPIVYVLTPILSFADYIMPLWVSVAGIVLLLVALYLFWRSHADLGRNWSPTLEIQEEHVLVSKGIYHHIRHPMYTSLWLWTLAQFMILPNWIVGPAGLIAFGLMYFSRVNAEEQMMRDRFGGEYTAYSQRTKRLIPYIL